MSYVNDKFKIGNTSWLNAQIALKITMPDGELYTFKNYIRMSVNRTANYNVYHGIGKYNQGYIKLPKGFTFSATVPVTSQDVQIFRSLFHSEAIFTLEYYDAQSISVTSNDTREFKLIQEKLGNCILTAMNDTYEVEGIPQVVFNGTALSNDFVATVANSYTDYEFADNSLKMALANVASPTMINADYWDYDKDDKDPDKDSDSDPDDGEGSSA